jgi:formamidopyrimidine-DNA glycosylase
MPELAETIRITQDVVNHIGWTGFEASFQVDNESWMRRKLKDDYDLFFSQSSKHVSLSTTGKKIMLHLQVSYEGGPYRPKVTERAWELRLGMSGRFEFPETLNDVDRKHMLFTMRVTTPDGNRKLVHYVDYRKFFEIKNLGIWERQTYKTQSLMELRRNGNLELTTGDFWIISPITKKPKITEILDEGMDTGIGNYLANEGLGRAKMDPKTPFKDQDEKKYLYMTIQGIALEAYAAGGHSFNGGYIRPNGEAGHFRPSVYGNPRYKRETFRGRTIYVE